MNRLDELVRATLDDHADDAPPAAPVVSRVLTDRRPHRRGWLVAAAASVVAIAVVAVGLGVSRAPDGGGSPSEPSIAQPPSADDRTAAIYSAALERFLRESSWIGNGIPEQVWIATRSLRPRQLGMAVPAQVGDPLSAEVREDISAAVASLTTLKWVTKLPVPDPDDPPQQAKATITLGTLPPGEHRVMAAIWALQGFNNGWLQSYIVERTGHRWTVTGHGGLTAVT